MTLADPSFHERGKIDIIFGVGVYHQIIAKGIKKLDNNKFALQKTRIGWIALGELNYNSNISQKSAQAKSADLSYNKGTQADKNLQVMKKPIQGCLSFNRSQTELLRIRMLPGKSPKLIATIYQSIKSIYRARFAKHYTKRTFDIVWCPLTDNFQYKLNSLIHGKISKRNIYSNLSFMFDPLGYLAPVISYAMNIKRRLDYSNTRVPKNIEKDWRMLLRTLSEIEKIIVPRYIGDLSPGAEVQLHAFSDASKKELAAAVYIRILRNNILSVRLIAVESQAIPITDDTGLARLELRAALLSAELMRMIEESMDLGEVNKFAWTNSRPVLAWIAQDSSSWSEYVATKVEKIHNLTDRACWNEIRESPVSWVGQGIRPSNLEGIKKWVSGPLWLRRSKREWPDKENEHLRAVDRMMMEASKSLIPLPYYEDMRVIETIVKEIKP